MKQPYSSTSDEESEELYASKGKKWRKIALVTKSDTCDKDKGDTDRSAWKEASDPGQKKKCQGRKATGKDKAGHKGQFVYMACYLVCVKKDAALITAFCCYIGDMTTWLHYVRQ